MVAYAVSMTPNEIRDWHPWKSYALAIYNAVDHDAGRLSEIFHEFSARWELGAS